MSSDTIRPSSNVHLVVIIHGLWGTPEHVSYLANTLAKTAQSVESRLEILCPKSIQSTHTYDGIDFCAERVAQEIDKKKSQLEHDGQRIIKFSCVGYSLGGLIARFLIGLLGSRKPSFFEDITPMNFTTFASPWVGIPNYGGVVGSTVHFFGSRSLSRTGNQLYLIDKFHRYPNSNIESNQVPLIAILAHPQTNFYKTLSKFKSLRIYANSINDRTVPFVTGAAEKVDGFQLSKKTFTKFLKSHSRILPSDVTEVDSLKLGGLEIAVNQNYPALIEKATFEQDRVPPTLLVESLQTGTPPTIHRRYMAKLPFFLRPSTYPFRKPFNVLAAIVSPILVPTFFIYVLGSFWYQSYQSRKRIRVYSLDGNEERTNGIGMMEELEHEMIEDLAGIGNPTANVPETATSLTTSPKNLPNDQQPPPEESLLLNLEDHQPIKGSITPQEHQFGTDYSYHLCESIGLSKIIKSHGLSPLQLEMIDHINQIPNLVKYFSFFDGVPNSHGAIIYRAEGLSDSRGKLVGKHWAERFIV